MAPLHPDQVRSMMITAGEPDRALVAAVDKGAEIWDTDAMQHDFTVEGFAAPFVVVRRKRDDVQGTMMFTHSPRLYFGFEPVR